VYRSRKVITIVPVFSEEARIGLVVQRTDRLLGDRLLVVDDGSTDATADVARSKGAEVLSLGRVMGVGAAIRAGFQAAQREGFNVAVIMAGNNKDDPSEIPRLLDPICDDRADFVMGSRYLPGGRTGGDISAYRRRATRFHPWLMSRFVGKRITESTNGFRAFRLTLLRDPRINLHQRWLDAYGLEVYLDGQARDAGDGAAAGDPSDGASRTHTGTAHRAVAHGSRTRHWWTSHQRHATSRTVKTP
jgi:dolichol-phosphate mannosyltransferase